MRRLPTEQLKRNGTFRPDRHTPQEPGADLLKQLPPAPFDLSEEAAGIYKEEGRRLIEMKILKASDLRLLAMYCNEYATYINETAAALEEGVVSEMTNGTRGTNPHRKVAETALKNALAIGDKLGLSPSARHRLQGGAAFQDERPKEESFFEKIMREAAADS